jgi:hypothetical protein
MPTLRYQNDGFVINEESSSTTTPRSIHISIALSPHANMKAAYSSTDGKTTFLGKQSHTTVEHSPQGGQPETHVSALSGAHNGFHEQFVAASAALPAAQAPFS